VLDVVTIVSVPVAAVVPEMVTEDVTVQLGAVIPPGGFASTQVRFTAPVNPFDGVAVIVDVLPVVAPGNTVTLPLFVSANPGAVLVTCAFSPSV
jgi:hypothetical protein